MPTPDASLAQLLDMVGWQDCTSGKKLGYALYFALFSSLCPWLGHVGPKHWGLHAFQNVSEVVVNISQGIPRGRALAALKRSKNDTMSAAVGARR